jgi:hypothetical protein
MVTVTAVTPSPVQAAQAHWHRDSGAGHVTVTPAQASHASIIMISSCCSRLSQVATVTDSEDSEFQLDSPELSCRRRSWVRPGSGSPAAAGRVPAP